MPEKARSGLSNLLSLALRKKVEKGSCGGERGALGGGQRRPGARTEAYYSEHPHQRGVSGGVQRGVVVGGGAVVLPRLVTLRVERRPLGVQRPDGLKAAADAQSPGTPSTLTGSHGSVPHLGQVSEVPR